MKKGYRVWLDELEVVSIIDEHNLCDGATKETYLCKGPNGKFVCSKDMYFDTELKAWEAHFNMLNEGIKNNKSDLIDLQNKIDEWEKLLENIKYKIQVLKLPVNGGI
jgi:hypothetical protein